ncbi:mCG144955, partial [Mus musculus]
KVLSWGKDNRTLNHHAIRHTSQRLPNSFQTNLCAVLSLTTLRSDGFIVHSSWQQAKSEVTALLLLWQMLAPPRRQCRPGHSATDTYTIHTTHMAKQGPQRGHLFQPILSGC